VPDRLFIGTAGWSIPRAFAAHCAGPGSHLERYARWFHGAEINSSFYRPHAASTYAKWAACAPPGFQFAVKVPRLITHELALRRTRAALERFLGESAGLQEKRGPLLVQLPGSQGFDARVAGRFFELLRSRHDGPLVCEPRHASWAVAAADALLARYRVARVAADPSRAPGLERPGGWPGLIYYRLHGSPRMYWSRYDDAVLDAMATALRARPASVDAWCIFDNTANGAAMENARELQRRLARVPQPSRPRRGRL
jgi:uncharacterized protein YecE (DUF72 family)